MSTRYGVSCEDVMEQVSKNKKVYIAGPMSHLPDFNFPAFNKAAEEWRAKGWVVFNPADKESETIPDEAMVDGCPVKAQKGGFNFREVYTWDVNKVIEADAIYLLPGWENSPGARGEHAVAVAMQKHYPDYEIIYS